MGAFESVSTGGCLTKSMRSHATLQSPPVVRLAPPTWIYLTPNGMFLLTSEEPQSDFLSLLGLAKREASILSKPVLRSKEKPSMTVTRRKIIQSGGWGFSAWALSSSNLLLAKAAGPGIAQRLKNTGVDFVEITKASEKAVRKGTDFLKKVINRDGSCGVDVNQQPDIGCTSMTGLAFLAQGNTPLEGHDSRELKLLRNFILKQTATMPSNDITTATGTQLQNKIGRHAHSFFAALFLSQVVGEAPNPEATHTGLRKVVAAIVKAQTTAGDWGSTSWAPTLGTVTGWVSLRASDFVGMRVGGAPNKTTEHLLKKMGATANQSRGWMHDLYKNAAGIRVLYAMKKENEPVAKQTFQKVLKLVTTDNTPFTQAGGEEFLAFHLITETMLQKGGEDWEKWFPVVRDKLIDVQNQDGSWTGHHCITSRTFCTAAAILVLTAPNRFLPISQS
jgi:hypothetical protein